MDDDWDDGPTSIPLATPEPTTYQVSGSNKVGKGRGFDPVISDDNGWSSGAGSFDSGRGGRGGSRDRGGRGGRGSRGGGRFSDEDRGGRREGDWQCPEPECGNTNFGWRNQCQKCNTNKPAGLGGEGGTSRGGTGRREGDWQCPDTECRNSNFGWRNQCQKCNTDKPAGLGGEGGNSKGGTERPKVELYIPPERADDDETLYGGGISSGINFDKYDSIKIKVTGNGCPEPIRDFESSSLRPFILENIRKSGYTKPTPVQKHAIPIIASGRDLMACAQTGSGKTAAFLIPIINTLLESPVDLMFEGDTCEPQVIIVTPTRELTIQIFDEVRKFSKGSILKVCVAYGGTGTMNQAQKMANGCHILVATPGRLNDFVNRGRVSFASTRFFVLDEADRMLDMGFLDDMRKMLEHPTMVATGTRQTLMFSATFPKEIQELASQFLYDYIFAVVGIVGGACSDVQQIFYQVSRKEKRLKLKELLQLDAEKVLVFVETKRLADMIAVFLSEQDIPTTSIHGDRMQRERETALNDFKYNRMRVLVATAVAARGLDIKGVAHVINFDMPKSIDEYVHRIGRTGRVGNRGKATSFFDIETDSALAGDLVKILHQAGQEVPDWLDTGSYNGGGFSSARNFGAQDYRKADLFNNGPEPRAAEVEEDWG